MIRVLLVEKNHDFRQGIVRQLEAMPQFKILEVSNETDLENILSIVPVNVALVGISTATKYYDMKILEKIHLIKPELPVIVMVPEKHTSLSIEAMRCGASDDIFVPFDVTELVDKINRILGKKKRKKARWREKLEKAMIGITFAEAGFDGYAKDILTEKDSSGKNGSPTPGK